MLARSRTKSARRGSTHRRRGNPNAGGSMALIKCSECGNDVSDKAAACPKCGNPIATVHAQAPAAVAITEVPVTAIEQTGKEYKAQMLMASILAGLGLAVM